VEGISFPSGKEGAVGASFGETGASTVAGAFLLELVFAFFGGGSTYPLSQHKNTYELGSSSSSSVWLYQQYG
jgi:hypothetical protein